MTIFTSSLPDDLLEKLTKAAKRLSIPKNRLIKKALEIYLDQLNRAEYVKSFKKASQDTDIMQIAEEGMTDYLKKMNEGMNETR